MTPERISYIKDFIERQKNQIVTLHQACKVALFEIPRNKIFKLINNDEDVQKRARV